MSKANEPATERLKREAEDAASAQGVHTCSAQCQRTACVLRRERDRWQREAESKDLLWRKAVVERSEAKAENLRLREALEFYAHPKNYEMVPEGGTSYVENFGDEPVLLDEGKRAREALAQAPSLDLPNRAALPPEKEGKEEK